MKRYIEILQKRLDNAIYIGNERLIDQCAEELQWAIAQTQK